MTVVHRKLTDSVLQIGGLEFQGQTRDWKLNNETDAPEIFHTHDSAESFAEPAEPNFNLELVIYSDWRSTGITEFLWAHDGETVTFQIDHHPLIVGEHVRWNGELLAQAPSVGGEARTTELTEVTLGIIDKPARTRP